MGRSRRTSTLALLVLVAISLLAPSGYFQPDPAAAARSTGGAAQESELPPATPGTYRSAASATNTPITGITISKPTGTTTNDVLLAALTIRGAAITITPPSGWTQVRSDASGSTVNQTIYRKVAGGSEPSSYAFTFSDPVSAAVGGIVGYTGVDTTTPIDVSGGQANASSTSVTAPSVTTTVANTQLVAFFGTANDTTFSAASGMTERYDTDADGSSQVAGAADDVAQAAAGASGTKVATAGIAAVNIGQLVALRPSGTITFRAAASTETVPTTSLTVNKPSGVTADDVLVASIAVRNDESITAPAGWTQQYSDDTSSMRMAVFTRTAEGSDGASYTWTFGDPVSTAIGGIIAFSGLDPVSPVDVSAGQVNGSSSSATAPSVSTTVGDATLVALYAIANDATFTPPAGMTERLDVLADTTADGAATTADVSVASAGATGTKVATASKSGDTIGVLVALRPATAIANLGMAPQHTFESWDLGAGDGLAVNVAPATSSCATRWSACRCGARQ